MDLAAQQTHKRAEEDSTGFDVSILVLAVVSGITMLVLTIISCICCYRQGNRRYSSRSDSRRDIVPLEDLLSKPSLADPESVFSEASYEGRLSVHTGSWIGLSGENSTVIQESVSYSGPSAEGRDCASFSYSRRQNKAEEDLPDKDSAAFKKWSSEKKVNVRSLKLIRAQEREQQLKRFSAQNENSPRLKPLDEELQVHRARGPPKSPKSPLEVRFSPEAISAVNSECSQGNEAANIVNLEISQRTDATNVDSQGSSEKSEASNIVNVSSSQKNESHKCMSAKVDMDIRSLKPHCIPVTSESHSFQSHTRCSFSHEVGHIALGNKVPRASLPRTDEPEEEEDSSKSSDESSQPQSHESEKINIQSQVRSELNKTSCSSSKSVDKNEQKNNVPTSTDITKPDTGDKLSKENSVASQAKHPSNLPPADLPGQNLKLNTGDKAKELKPLINANRDNLPTPKSKTSIEANIIHTTEDFGDCEHEPVAMRRSLSCVHGANRCPSYQGGTGRRTFSLNLKIDFHFDDDSDSKKVGPTVVCSPCAGYKSHDKHTEAVNNTIANIQKKLKNSNEMMNSMEANEKEKLLEHSFATKFARINSESPAVIKKRCSDPAILGCGHYEFPSIAKVNRRFSAVDAPFAKGRPLDPHRPMVHTTFLKNEVNRTNSNHSIPETESASCEEDLKISNLKDSKPSGKDGSDLKKNENISNTKAETTSCLYVTNPSSDEESKNEVIKNQDSKVFDEKIATSELKGGDDITAVNVKEGNDGLVKEPDPKGKNLCDDVATQVKSHDETKKDSSDVTKDVSIHACKATGGEACISESLSTAVVKDGMGKAQISSSVSTQKHLARSLNSEHRETHSSTDSGTIGEKIDVGSVSQVVDTDLPAINNPEPVEKSSPLKAESEISQAKARNVDTDADAEFKVSLIETDSKEAARDQGASATACKSRAPKIMPRKARGKHEGSQQVSEDSESQDLGVGNKAAILIASSKKNVSITNVERGKDEDALRSNALNINTAAKSVNAKGFTSDCPIQTSQEGTKKQETFHKDSSANQGHNIHSPAANEVKLDDGGCSLQKAQHSESQSATSFESSAKHTVDTAAGEKSVSSLQNKKPGKPVAAPRKHSKESKHPALGIAEKDLVPKPAEDSTARRPSGRSTTDKSRIPILYVDDDDADDEDDDSDAKKEASSKTSVPEVNVKQKMSVSSLDGNAPTFTLDGDSSNNNTKCYSTLDIPTTHSSAVVEASDDSDYDNPWDNLDDAVKRASIRYNRRPSRIAAGDDKTLLLKSAEDLGRLLEEADKRRQLRQAAARSTCQVLSPEDNTESMTIPFTRFSPHRHTVKGIVSQPYLASSQSSENILKTQGPTFPKLSLLKSEDPENFDRGIDARRPKSLTAKVKSKIKSPESMKRKK